MIAEKPEKVEKPRTAAFIDPLTAMMNGQDDEDALGLVALKPEDEMENLKSKGSHETDR